jgi:hypothetical protein
MGRFIARCRSASTHDGLLTMSEKRVVLTEIPPEHKTFIESRDMFFLSTIDHQGRPTVSYKGSDPGFVRVFDNKTIAFPCYDGNGMFYSMGNLMGNGQVWLAVHRFRETASTASAGHRQCGRW